MTTAAETTSEQAPVSGRKRDFIGQPDAHPWQHGQRVVLEGPDDARAYGVIAGLTPTIIKLKGGRRFRRRDGLEEAAGVDKSLRWRLRPERSWEAPQRESRERVVSLAQLLAQASPRELLAGLRAGLGKRLGLPNARLLGSR